jgi:hypothetical protein
MKTAMELTLARIEMLYIEKDSIHWEMFKNDCMEKEKKQIIDAYESKVKEHLFAPITSINKSTGEEYYNQTYNLNK